MFALPTFIPRAGLDPLAGRVFDPLDSWDHGVAAARGAPTNKTMKEGSEGEQVGFRSNRTEDQHNNQSEPTSSGQLSPNLPRGFYRIVLSYLNSWHWLKKHWGVSCSELLCSRVLHVDEAETSDVKAGTGLDTNGSGNGRRSKNEFTLVQVWC